MSRLHVKYNEEIAPALMTKFQYKSVMQIPKLSKVIVNVGCGEKKNLFSFRSKNLCQSCVRTISHEAGEHLD